MTAAERRRDILGAFADLLAYPDTDPTPAARRCRALAGRRSARHLDAFLARLAGARPQEMEEAYAATFDLQPTCAPYVGHHLCGDGPRRGLFLARLAGVYREDGFEPPAGGELPDHLSVVLRYLSVVPGGEARDALLRDGLVPALDRMLDAPGDPAGGYRSVLAALREEVS